jgi:hypothetical protein
MSRLDKLLAGWTFRTSTPVFEPGEVLTAHVTGSDSNGLSVRIGDSLIRLPEANGLSVETKIKLRVTSFDENSYEGSGELVEVLGDD